MCKSIKVYARQCHIMTPFFLKKEYRLLSLHVSGPTRCGVAKLSYMSVVSCIGQIQAFLIRHFRSQIGSMEAYISYIYLSKIDVT